MLPYSEPDQDLSPPDNTDWNWGGGQARPPDSAAVAENVGLTEKILADTNNVISEYRPTRRSSHILLTNNFDL